MRNSFPVGVEPVRKDNRIVLQSFYPARGSTCAGFFYFTNCIPMSIYDNLSEAEYRIEDDPEGPTLRMYKPGKDGRLERVNAFIRPDKALVKEKGLEVYTRLNMPEEDKVRLAEWFGILELKHT